MSTLPSERALWISVNISGILYGFGVYMALHSWYLLNGVTTQTARMRKVYLGFTLIQLLLFTLETVTNGLQAQFMWIDHRNFPGGPLAYYFATGNEWFSVLNALCGVLSLALSDALLLYRCYIIWNTNWRIIIFPVSIYIGESVMGIMFVLSTAIPKATFFTEQPTSFAVPWISLGTSLNVILTGLIVGRLVYASRQVHSSNYTGVVAILVESAVPLTLSGVAFVAAMRANVIEASVILATLNGGLNIISPQAIILRVAMGKAWKETTMGEILTNMNFAERKQEGSGEKPNSSGRMITNGSDGELSGSVSTIV